MMKERGKISYLVFMDLESACDSVDREAFWLVLAIYGEGVNFFTGLNIFYEQSRPTLV